MSKPGRNTGPPNAPSLLTGKQPAKLPFLRMIICICSFLSPVICICWFLPSVIFYSKSRTSASAAFLLYLLHPLLYPCVKCHLGAACSVSLTWSLKPAQFLAHSTCWLMKLILVYQEASLCSLGILQLEKWCISILTQDISLIKSQSLGDTLRLRLYPMMLTPHCVSFPVFLLLHILKIIYCHPVSRVFPFLP